MQKRFKIFRQLDSMDCGPTCLKMIFNYYGLKVSRDRLRNDTQITKKGVSLLGIAQTAEKYGFKTIAAKISIEQLIKSTQLPCLIHWNQYHVVILIKVKRNKYFVVADPGRGRMVYTKKEFLDHFIKEAEPSETKEAESKGIALFITPGLHFNQVQNEYNENTEGLKWNLLLKYLSKYKLQLIQLAIGLILGSLLQAVFPYLTQSIVDVGINSNDLGFIQLVLIAQFALFFAQVGIDFVRSRILLFISTHINLSILSDFWIKLLKLPLSFFETRLTGDLLQRINDHNRIERFITGTALQTVFSLFSFFVFSIILFTYNQNIFWVFIASSILYLGWISIFLRYRKKIDIQRFGAASKENSITIQLIEGINEIKLNNAEHLKLKGTMHNVHRARTKDKIKSPWIT